MAKLIIEITIPDGKKEWSWGSLRREFADQLHRLRYEFMKHVKRGEPIPDGDNLSTKVRQVKWRVE